MMNHELKSLIEEFEDLIAPLEQLDDTAQYIAVIALMRIMLEERLGNAIDLLKAESMQ